MQTVTKLFIQPSAFFANVLGVIDGKRLGEKTPSKSASFFAKLPISPNLVTILGIFFAILAAYLIASSRDWLAVICLTLSGITDFFDGLIAKAKGRQSRQGTYLDSVVDRVVEAILIAGFMWYFIDSGRSKLALLPFAVGVTGYLISYQRAKAESMQVQAKGGLMERAERLILLGVALGFNGIVMVPVLWLLLGLNALTVIMRFYKVWIQLSNQERRKEPSFIKRIRLSERRRMSEKRQVWGANWIWASISDKSGESFWQNLRSNYKSRAQRKGLNRELLRRRKTRLGSKE